MRKPKQNPAAATINKLVERDKRRFEEAVTKLGGVAGGKEPIALLTDRYEEPLGSKLTAAELNITEPEFINKLKGHELLKSTGLNTLAAGGKIARETWEKLFPLVVTSLGVGDPRFNSDQFRKFNDTIRSGVVSCVGTSQAHRVVGSTRG
jgi:hypothetical protein